MWKGSLQHLRYRVVMYVINLPLKYTVSYKGQNVGFQWCPNVFDVYPRCSLSVMHVILISFISAQMVICWLCGDIYKTLYFIVRIAPMQFWVCSSLQVMVDIMILLQVWVYKDRRVQLHPKSPRTKSARINLE